MLRRGHAAWNRYECRERASRSAHIGFLLSRADRAPRFCCPCCTSSRRAPRAGRAGRASHRAVAASSTTCRAVFDRVSSYSRAAKRCTSDASIGLCGAEDSGGARGHPRRAAAQDRAHRGCAPFRAARLLRSAHLLSPPGGTSSASPSPMRGSEEGSLRLRARAFHVTPRRRRLRGLGLDDVAGLRRPTRPVSTSPNAPAHRRRARRALVLQRYVELAWIERVEADGASA